MYFVFSSQIIYDRLHVFKFLILVPFFNLSTFIKENKKSLLYFKYVFKMFDFLLHNVVHKGAQYNMNSVRKIKMN